jgi:hypothetical protein
MLLEIFEGKVQLAKYITNHFKAIYPYGPHNDFRHRCDKIVFPVNSNLLYH